MMRFALLTLHAAGTLAACSADKDHPKNGGYYIEGVGGLDKASAHAPGAHPNGKDKTEWKLPTDGSDAYYPHGETKLCTGMFCSDAARTVGSKQYLSATTCALVRFSYA